MKRNEKKPQTPELRAKRISIILYIGVTLSFIVPIIFIVLMMVFGNGSMSDAGYHSKADYALMIVQCVLGLISINLPSLLAKRFKFEIPVVLYALFSIFLYCAIFLGEVRSFYYVIPYWDSILHCFSSLMLGFFGFMVITIINRNENTLFNLSPFFVAFFAFCFAVTIGSLWEIYEFTFDGLLGLNMQKFMLADGTMLVGREALRDTMKDIIVDSIGAFISSTVGYISIKHNKRNWLVPKLDK